MSLNKHLANNGLLGPFQLEPGHPGNPSLLMVKRTNSIPSCSGLTTHILNMHFCFSAISPSP